MEKKTRKPQIKIINDVIEKYGSVKKFILQFKKGNAERIDDKKIFMGYRTITISENEMTEGEKNIYCRILQEVLGNLEFEQYVDIDELNKCISEMTEKRRAILLSAYTQNRRLKMSEIKETVDGKLKNSYQLLRDAKNDLRYNKGRFIVDVREEEQKTTILKKKIEKLGKAIDDVSILKFIADILDENPEMQNVFLSDLELTGEAFLVDYRYYTLGSLINAENLPMLFYNFSETNNIEELGFQKGIAKTLKSNGITEVSKLLRCTAEDIIAMPGLGQGCLKKIENELADRRLKLKGNNKKRESWNEKLQNFREFCEELLQGYSERREKLTDELCIREDRCMRYEIAKRYFMDEEDVLNPEAIIPKNPRKDKEKREVYTIRFKQMELDCMKKCDRVYNRICGREIP